MTASEKPQGGLDKPVEPAKLIATKSVTQARVWVRYDRNIQLEADGWHVSFNGHTDELLIPWGAGDTSRETALVKDGRYYILNGDWRKQYEERFDEGFEKCLELFLAHPEAQSSWSDEWVNDMAKLDGGLK